MSKMRLAAVVAAPLLLSPVLPAQESAHVVSTRSAVSRDAVRPGETFMAAVILKVQEGYHINDNAPLDEFMFPTSLTIDDNPDFELIEIYYPTGRRARFSYSETELVIYEGETALGVLLKAKEGLPAGTKILKTSLSYQACDSTSCLPPKELAFEISVPVSEKGGAEVQPELFGKFRFKSLRK